MIGLSLLSSAFALHAAILSSCPTFSFQEVVGCFVGGKEAGVVGAVSEQTQGGFLPVKQSWCERRHVFC